MFYETDTPAHLLRDYDYPRPVRPSPDRRWIERRRGPRYGRDYEAGPVEPSKDEKGFTIAGLEFSNVPTWAWIAGGAALFFLFGKK
jgi:hypothetical protein